jgi:RNA polymerase sigma factor (TIGR02999 family)
MQDGSDVTGLLRRASVGDQKAVDALVPLVYDELRSIAHARLRGERSGHTLSTTALVHESYLKLVDINQVKWQDRAHFFSVASRMMRRVLVDYAKARGAKKRGGDWRKVELEELAELPSEQVQAIEDLDEALTKLEEVSPRQSRLLEHRYFGGLKLKECAEVLGVSIGTVKNELRFARAWLARELGAQTGGA